MRVTYYVAASVDGYIAGPGGSLDFLDCVSGGDHHFGYQDFWEGVDALVMGRTTWDFVAGVEEWPYGTMPVRVFTHSPIHPPHDQVRAVEGSVRPVLDELASSGARHVWLVGGGDLAAAFLAEGALDELILSVVPTTLGAGIPLIGSGVVPAGLELKSSRAYDEGLVQMHYQVVPPT